jgi:hypothetical protein
MALTFEIFLLKKNSVVVLYPTYTVALTCEKFWEGAEKMLKITLYI